MELTFKKSATDATQVVTSLLKHVGMQIQIEQKVISKSKNEL
jgi:hypothetical protein